MAENDGLFKLAALGVLLLTMTALCVLITFELLFQLGWLRVIDGGYIILKFDSLFELVAFGAFVGLIIMFVDTVYCYLIKKYNMVELVD